MAITFEELESLLKQEDVSYFVTTPPEKSHALFIASGKNGDYNIVLKLDCEGQFLQLRTVSYVRCTEEHPHVLAVLKAMGAINYTRRLVKMGWDASDGEIAVYADLWLMDNNLTCEQFERVLHNFLVCVDLDYGRLTKIMESGQDPGDPVPEGLVDLRAGDTSAVAETSADLLNRLRALKPKLGPSASTELEL